jgi:hypothetical protein
MSKFLTQIESGISIPGESASFMEKIVITIAELNRFFASSHNSACGLVVRNVLFLVHGLSFT